jgi:hypothetical protein
LSAHLRQFKRWEAMGTSRAFSWLQDGSRVMERAARMREAGTGYHQTDDKAGELVHRTREVTIHRFTPSSAKQVGLKDIEILIRDALISCSALPFVLSFLVLVSWVSSHSSYLWYPSSYLRP